MPPGTESIRISVTLNNYNMQINEIQLVAKPEKPFAKSETGLLYLLVSLGLAGLIFLYSQTLNRDTPALTSAIPAQIGAVTDHSAQPIPAALP